MITTPLHCRQCNSTNSVYTGQNRVGNPQDLCKDCRASGVLTPHPPKSPAEQRDTMLRAYQERPRMRGLQRIVGVSRNTLAKGSPAHVQHLPPLSATVPPVQADDVLEVDEAWSFVPKKPLHGGSGPGCSAARGLSWPISSGSTARRPVANAGNAFPARTVSVPGSGILGTRLRTSFPRVRLSAWDRRRVKPPIRTAGTIRYVNGSAGRSARRDPVPTPTVGMIA
jgi:transposase-like protein